MPESPPAAFPARTGPGRQLPAPGLAVPGLGPRRPGGDLPGGGRSLPPVCVAGLPVGAPHDHLPSSQGARRRDLDDRSSTRSVTRAGGRSPRVPATRPIRSTGSPFSARPTRPARRGSRAASRSRCCGTPSPHGSSTTNRRTSSGCSTGSSSAIAAPDAPVFCPPELEDEIDQINATVYAHVNNGVYRAGFATTQARLRARVPRPVRRPRHARRGAWASAATCSATGSPRPTGACLRRWCGSTRSMSATSSATCAGSSTTRTSSGYLRDLYQQPEVADTVNFDHIKRHYYRTHIDDQPDPDRPGRSPHEPGRPAWP